MCLHNQPTVAPNYNPSFQAPSAAAYYSYVSYSGLSVMPIVTGTNKLTGEE